MERVRTESPKIFLMCGETRCVGKKSPYRARTERDAADIDELANRVIQTELTILDEAKQPKGRGQWLG